ncbi:hypothetical protein AXL65_02270 [Salmonella enterica subsp. enterica]|nr:hypothetical protein [Salmonella enterica subsp. enterica]
MLLERNTPNQLLRVVLIREGKPVPVNPAEQVLFALFDGYGRKISAFWEQPDPNATYANWIKGEIVVKLDTSLSPVRPALDNLDRALLVVKTPMDRFVFELQVGDQDAIERSQLFIKDVAVREMRQDQLMVAASGAMREVKVSDDYLWSKLKAAESEIAHKLRILLTPHQIFPHEPTPDELTALNGMPYMVETPYDYQPQMFDRDKWGYFITRQRPIIEVQRLRFSMPSAGNQYFDIPHDWLRLDEKYGHVRILPTTNASLVTASVLGFTALTWQSIIPNMLRLTYTAGLKNAAEDYPELLDAIKKMAVVKIITDLFLPQSGSISADGLSESMSTDVGKYLDLVDHIINGDDGNGGLMAMFNGIRAIVI